MTADKLVCVVFLAWNICAGLSFEELSVGVWAPDTASTHVTAVSMTLNCFGIPHVQSSSFNSLTKHRVIVAAGPLYEPTLQKKEIARIYAWVESGGRLFLAGDIGRSLYFSAGIDSLVRSSTRFSITLKPPTSDPILRYANLPEERLLRLGNASLYPETFFTFAAHASRAVTLARFDDNTPAFIRNDYGLGTVYYLGAGWDETILRPHIGKDNEAQASWINGFEYTTDMFMLFIKTLYETSVSPALSVPAVPDGFRTALLLSHDVDARESFANAVAFARLEKKYGVTSTFFITAKFFSDKTDTAYFTSENSAHVSTLCSLGFSIGSHSVSHFKSFYQFETGVPLEERSQYRPWDRKTLFGEVQVSKWLLADAGAHVQSFRSGYLAYPDSLVTVLEAAGYSVNSSFSANDIMCNFPFRALARRSPDAPISSVLEVPVTLDESMGFLRNNNRDSVIGIWNQVIDCNAENGAITSLLIHPNIIGYKLRALDDIIRAERGKGIWICDVDAYARFFQQRYEISIADARYAKRTLYLRLSAAIEDIPGNFTIALHQDPGIRKFIITDSKRKRLQYRIRAQGDDQILFGLAIDKKFYEFQKKLAFAIAAAFCCIICVLCGFIVVQRLVIRNWVRWKDPQEHADKVLGILASEDLPVRKAKALKALGSHNLTRAVLVEMLDYIKGSLADEIIMIYGLLGYYLADLRRLKSPKWWVRAQSARTLGFFITSEFEENLLPLLSDRQEEVRLAAAYTLGRIQSTTALPLLIDLIKMSDSWTAGMIIQYLLPLKDQASRSLLETLERGGLTDTVTAAIAEALGNLRDINAVPALVALLNETSRTLRIAALEALGKISDESALPHLYGLLTDPDAMVQQAALRAIARIGSANAVEHVVIALDTFSPLLAREAMHTIYSLDDAHKSQCMELLNGPHGLGALEVLEENNYIEEALRQSLHGTPEQRKQAKVLFSAMTRMKHTKHLDDLRKEGAYSEPV